MTQRGTLRRPASATGRHRLGVAGDGDPALRRRRRRAPPGRRGRSGRL